MLTSARAHKPQARITTLILTAFVISACSAPATPTPAPATATAARTEAPTVPASDDTLETLVAPGAVFEPVARDGELFEGPLYLPDGRWLVSEIPANTVWAFDDAGAKQVHQRPSNKANGRALDAQGALIQAEHATAAIVRIDPGGARTVLAERYGDKRFNSPNDIAIARDGTIWFTDPTWGLESRAAELDFTGVYRLDPVRGEVVAVIKTIKQPNGIAFSPDERTLYVSGVDGRVIAFSVGADGALDGGRDFGPGADGIKVDARGNVWTTGGRGVDVIRADGTLLGRLALPEDSTNLAFGGPDGKTVFATTFKGVYRLRLR